MNQVRSVSTEEDHLTVRALVGYLAARRASVLRGALIGGLAVVLVVLAGGRRYSSTFTFYPRIAGATSGISGIAAQLGLSVPGVDIAQSPSFYPELVRSRTVLGEIVDSVVLREGGGVDLLQALGVPDESSAVQREEALYRLRDVVSASVSPRTGVVRVRVTAKDGETAYLLAAQLERIIEKFVIESRQTQASAERAFNGRRLVELQAELAAAEEALRDFVTRNRQYEQSAETRLQADRLQRAVSLRHGVVAALQQAMEQARIEEARDTPTINFVDHAERPVYADRRRLAVKSLAGLVGGALLSAALLLAFSSSATIAAYGAVSVRGVLRDLLADARSPWRTARRVVGLR